MDSAASSTVLREHAINIDISLDSFRYCSLEFFGKPSRKFLSVAFFKRKLNVPPEVSLKISLKSLPQTAKSEIFKIIVSYFFREVPSKIPYEIAALICPRIPSSRKSSMDTFKHFSLIPSNSNLWEFVIKICQKIIFF